MIKFFKYLVLILSLICSPAYAANYYFDLASGNDGTGDGSAGNPWKTFDKCTTSRSAGDECRAAKTAITTLTGTLTFTDGSTTVTTSSDQSAVVAANDVISKQGTGEGWWKVASVAADAITLSATYYGSGTGSGDAVTGYKITPVTSTDGDIQSAGSAGSYLKISGGWDLTGPTQDGITAFTTSEASPFDWNAKVYVWIDNFIIVPQSSYAVDSLDGNYAKLTNIYSSGSATIPSGPHIDFRSFAEADNLVLTGGAGIGIILDHQCSFKNIYMYSIGNASPDYTINCANSHGVYFDTLRIMGSAYTTISVTEFSAAFFKNFYIGAPASGYGFDSAGVVSDVRFHTGTMVGDVRLGIPFVNVSFINMASIGAISHSTAIEGTTPMVTVCVSGSDCYLSGSKGTITHDSSANARSGKALKFDPSEAETGIFYKVGTVKIPSTASDITLNAYLKDDADFNGGVIFWVSRNGYFISKTNKTPTTSYVKESVVVDTTDLVANEYLDLFVQVHGTAGNVWIDDFSAEQ